MKIGFYQHGSTTEAGVAEAISALGVKVNFRNALYFNERETEKFDRVVVDEGKNTDAVRTAYKAAGVSVSTVDEFIADQQKQPTPLPKKPETPLNPDQPRAGRKPGKKQGE